MKRPCKLAPEIIANQLAKLPSWQLNDGQIVRDYPFPSYLAGADFVMKVAHAAEAMNHHPDLHLGWRSVRVTLSTHDAGGITELDFTLAAQVEALFASSEA